MSYFIYNGQDSRDYGILEHTPMPPSAQKIVQYQQAGNRATKIATISETYDNITLSCTLGLKSRENLRSAVAWLQGSGLLTFSDEPDKYYKIMDVVRRSERLSARFGKIALDFIALPFAYALDPTVQDITAATINTAVENAGTVFAEPEIRFTATGTEVSIYTNNEQFRVELSEEVQGVEVIVDCAAQVTYYVSGGSKVAINQHTYGEYPILHVGTNVIRHAGTVSAASINVKERWL